MYVGEDGARYKVMEHPHKVDATKFLHTNMNGDGDIFLRRGIGLELPATSRESKGTVFLRSMCPFNYWPPERNLFRKFSSDK